MPKISISDLDVRDQRTLVRVDFNVPLKTTDDGLVITDDTRITSALPTIEWLVKGGARVILVSHLGRPKGERDLEYSLAPVADHLRQLLPGTKVGFADDCIGERATAAVEALGSGEVLLLENVRFHPGEEANDDGFARELAALADVYVNDAFGTAHRAHASTAGIAAHVKTAAMGLLMERELEYLVERLESPERPFLVIMGGAKVSDKIQVIMAMMDKADAFIIGGAMAYTFRKAQGYTTGDSRVEADKLDLALQILEAAEAKGVRFLLPADTRETQEFKDGAETRCTTPYADGGGISDGWEGIDIGDAAIVEFKTEIAKAKTILWNGPMGVFEIDTFARGTREIAQAVADTDAVTIIGGGDSVTAVNKFGLADKMSFISTGGGASLELLEGKQLPGVAALTDK